MTTDPTCGQVAAYLAEAGKRAESAERALILGGSFAEAAAKSQRDVPRLLAAVEAVLAVHCPYQTAGGWPSEQVCGNCADAYGEPVDWPCETVQAISAALLGEEKAGG